MPSIPPIEYQHGFGPKLTPEDPCTFRDHCTPNDAAAWVYLAETWTEAAAAGATTPERGFTIQRLRTYVAQLREGAVDCTVADCETFVRGLIGATERARMLVLAWGVETPSVPGPWEPAEGWPGALLGQGGGLWKLLPWLVLAAFAAGYFGERRR